MWGSDKGHTISPRIKKNFLGRKEEKNSKISDYLYPNVLAVKAQLRVEEQQFTPVFQRSNNANLLTASESRVNFHVPFFSLLGQRNTIRRRVLKLGGDHPFPEEGFGGSAFG